MTSCGFIESAKAEFALFRTEFTDIKEFFSLTAFDSDETLQAPFDALAAAHDAANPPILTNVYHTDELPSVYSHASTESVSLTEAEKYGYTAVPHFTSNDVSGVALTLAGYGIETNIVTRRNAAPADEVYAIEFAGFTDDDGYYINNKCPVTLYVSAEKPELPDIKADGSNVVYLTYDDGPTYSDTIRLLDVLDTYGIKATFFVTGEAVRKYPEAARAITARGHSLGCHSVTHDYKKIYETPDALREEILEWEEIVAEAGITLDDGHKLFRFPGGSVGNYLTEESSAEMTDMLQSLFYRIYDWNVVTNDSLLYTAPEGINTYDYIRDTFQETFAVQEKLSDTPIIILMHETVPETIDLMPWMIEYLIEKGYTFAPLTAINTWMF